MSSLTKQQIDEARKHFTLFDPDKSGYIHKKELRKLLESTLKLTISNRAMEIYVDNELKQADLNGDNMIDFTEFLHFYSKILAKKELLPPVNQNINAATEKGVGGKKNSHQRKPSLQKFTLSHEQINEAKAFFDNFDKDKSGYIDKQELTEIVRSTMKVKLSEKALEMFVNAELSSADKNRDNVIDFDEFLVIYSKLILRHKAPAHQAQTHLHVHQKVWVQLGG